MKKPLVFLIIGTILIFILGVFLVSKGSKSGSSSSTYPQPTNLTYYWGNGCPHCANVDAFLKTWDKKDTVTIDKKEVWYNAANARELQARYKSCGIVNPNDMGVPLLFTTDGKCLSGDQPIIEYFKALK